MEAEQTPLPGVGIRYDFATAACHIVERHANNPLEASAQRCT
jgi:hypothetical protein